MAWEDLNDQQREKLKRKEELKKEISELTRNLKREEFLCVLLIMFVLLFYLAISPPPHQME